MSDFLIHVTIMAGIFSLLALSLNLQVGFGGLMNFGQIALFGCGTYGAALAFEHDLGMVSGLLFGLLAAAVGGWVVASIGRNLQGGYWGIVTLALAEVLRLIATNEDRLTGGAQGISGIPPFFTALEGRPQQLAILALVLGCVLLAWFLCDRLTGGRYGLGLKIMREEPQLSAALGYDIIALKRQSMVLGGLIAAVSGFLFAHYVSFVGPDQLGTSETFLIWAMVVIGGLGNNAGAILGAFLLQFTFAFVPFVKDLTGLPTEFVAATRLCLIGGGLVAFILWRQAGLIPEKTGRSRHV